MSTDLYVSFLSGCAGGVSLVLCGHPLDSLKVRVANGMSTNFQSAIRDMYRIDGLKTFYRGMLSPLVAVPFINASLFLSWGLSKQICGHETYLELGAAGVLTGAIISLLEGPVELVKSKAQVSGISVAEGVRVAARSRPFGLGFAQGFTATVLRNVPANAAYFVIFEAALHALGGRATADFFTLLQCGLLSGTSYWLLGYPADNLKTRMQSDATEPHRRRYTSTWQCAREVMRHEGYRGFFTGLLPCLLRAGPANAVNWVCVEYARDWLTHHTSHHDHPEMAVLNPPYERPLDAPIFYSHFTMLIKKKGME